MTITINGIECPLHFGIRACKKFYDSVETDLKADDTLRLEQIIELVWAGIDNAAYRDRKPIPVEFKEVYDEVESMFFNPEKASALVKVYEAFADSQFVKSYTQKDEDVKKKAKRSSGKKLKDSPLEN